MGNNFQKIDSIFSANTRTQKTEETRVVKIFTWLPLWLNRLSWLQRIEVMERKQIVFEQWFDEGGTELFYWAESKEEWIKEKIIN